MHGLAIFHELLRGLEHFSSFKISEAIKFFETAYPPEAWLARQVPAQGPVIRTEGTGTLPGGGAEEHENFWNTGGVGQVHRTGIRAHHQMAATENFHERRQVRLADQIEGAWPITA